MKQIIVLESDCYEEIPLMMLFLIWKNLNLGMNSSSISFIDCKFLMIFPISYEASTILVMSFDAIFFSNVKTFDARSLVSKF